MPRVPFDDLDVGDEIGPLRLTLDGEQVRRYALIANMPGGRFLSDEAAQREGLPGQIVPGNLSLALLSRLLAEALPGTRLRKLSGTFRAMIRAGSALVIRGVVTERHATENGDSIECDLILESEEGDRLVTGAATVALPRST